MRELSLAEQRYRAVLEVIAEGRTVGEVAECTSVDLSVVSRHLALLARSGVVEATKQGRTVTYRVRYAEVSSALRSLATALDGCCPDGGESCGC